MHIQASIWYSNMHKVKRERDRVSVKGSSANNKICFKVRAPSSTSPPSPPWRISNPLAYPQRTPTKGTSTEDLGQSQLQGVPSSSPYKHNLLLEAQLQANKQSPHNLRDFSQTNTRITSQLEGYNPNAQPPQHNEGKAQSQAKIGFTTWWSNKQPQTISFPTQGSYRMR